MTSDSTYLPDIRYTQNFLKSGHLVDRLLDRSSIGPDDLVVEIGPGKGRITTRLAARCRCLLAVEKDDALVAHLRQRLGKTANVVLFHGDGLTFPLPVTPYKVFSSIPFNITAALIARFLNGPNVPEDVYLVMQREAANRILGVPSESVFALFLKPWFEPSRFHYFSRNDFAPRPRVEVVMLRLQKRGPPLISEQHAQVFRDFIAHCFSHQKALDTLFRHFVGRSQTKHLLTELDIVTRPSPTAVKFEQWLILFKHFIENADHRGLQQITGADVRLQQQQQRLTKRHRTYARTNVVRPER